MISVTCVTARGQGFSVIQTFGDNSVKFTIEIQIVRVKVVLEAPYEIDMPKLV